MLTTQNLILSLPCQDDLSAIKDFEDRNLNHLRKWESTNSKNDQPVQEEIQKRLENWIKECEEGKSVRFFIRPKDDSSKIIGFCNFTQIFHGAFKACYLGYKIDYKYEGKRLMFEALEASITHVFEELGLNRIMANYMPINTRSAKLLHRLGFIIEGYAKHYLLINGQWEDHILTALSVEQWRNIQDKNASTLDSKSQEIDDSLIYREVQVVDTSFLVPLMEQLGYPIDPTIMRENIQKYIQLPNQKAWVAEKSGQIVGCIAVAITNYFHRPSSFLRVIAMIVDGRERRSGIGRNLMYLAEKFALDQGCSHIELTSGMHREKSGSHEFYQSLGYTELNDTKKYFAKKL
jgi:[ribosomal protein S5]-alanine N-acetyltransferase